MNIAHTIDIVLSAICIMPTIYLLASSQDKHDTGCIADAGLLLCGLGMWLLFGGLAASAIANIAIAGYKNLAQGIMWYTLARMFATPIYLRFLVFMANKTAHKAHKRLRARAV